MTGRIGGLDLARAAALIGMVGAHVGHDGTRIPGGWEWLWIVHGRSSALFAVLAGVTIALMRDRPGRDAGAMRRVLLVRGAILIAAGYLLDALGTPVDVILANLGLMMVLLIPAVTWRPAVLAGAGAGVLVLGGLAHPSVVYALEGIPVVEKLTSYHYPAIAWTGYLLVGIALGALRLRTTPTAVMVAGGGAVVVALAYGVGAVASQATPWSAFGAGPAWATLEPHSYSPAELLGNVGVAALVIGACQLLVNATSASGPRRGAAFHALSPALAFGSMSLTMYVAHLLVIAVAGDDVVWAPSNTFYVALTLSLMAAATVWAWAAGKGPLERVMAAATRAAARDGKVRAVRADTMEA